MPSILELIENLDDLSDKEKDVYRNGVQVKHVSKGTILQRKDDLALKAFYVNSGLLRSYAIDEKGKEHIYMFAPEDWVVGDMMIEDELQRAQLYVDTIEDSEIEIVDMRLFTDIDKLIPINQSSSEIRRLMKRINVLQNRVIMLMSANAGERYEEFVKTYPQIIQRAPQKMIASYLGITPEALSKIKSEQLRRR